MDGGALHIIVKNLGPLFHEFLLLIFFLEKEVTIKKPKEFRRRKNNQLNLGGGLPPKGS